ncbi:hypothetical protein [Mesorhizobium opportunistum]|uniref:hypothetical protein n=1 Tax=Mesorhizobium opportunistum TaxID=593909 RepID=UPI00333B48BD
MTASTASLQLDTITRGKRSKASYVMLSPELLGILHSYWRLARHKTFCFLGAILTSR